MADTQHIDYEVKLTGLYSELALKENMLLTLKDLLDEKINDKSRDENCKRFVKDLKNFKSHHDFSRFLKEASGKIESQHQEYLSLQSVYNVLKGEVKGLTDKVVDAERVMAALREHNIHCEIEDFMK